MEENESIWRFPAVIIMADDTTPIAIVGMSCRLPGAASTEELWRLCAEQRDVWQPFSEARNNHSTYYHPDPGRNGTSNVLGGHFLEDDPGLFDAAFFNLNSTEASVFLSGWALLHV